MDYIINNFNEIATAIFVACFTAWLGWRTWQRARITTAHDNFRRNVLTIVNGLYRSKKRWRDPPTNMPEVLASIHSELQNEVSIYASVLDKRSRQIVMKAWDVYRFCPDRPYEVGEHDYGHYMGLDIDGHYIDPYKLFNENIDKLISVAK